MEIQVGSRIESPDTSSTLENLDNLMLEEDFSFTDTSGTIMKELEELINPVQVESSMDSWTNGMLTSEDEEEWCSPVTDCRIPTTNSANPMNPNNTQRDPSQDFEKSRTHLPDKRDSTGFSDSTGDSENSGNTQLIDRRDSPGLSNRSDLINLLQQCVASHLSEKPNRAVEEPYAFTVRPVSRDIMGLLHDCAHAVAIQDVANANSLAVAIRTHGASPYAGDVRQRVSYYFVESLMARALGTGVALSAAVYTPPDVMDKVYEFRLHATPSPLLPHYFSTRAMLDAFAGKKLVHIVEIGMSRNRFQWSLILNTLSRRPGGPPTRLRITVVDSPSQKRLLEQLSSRLTAECTSLGIGTEVEVLMAQAHSWEMLFPRIVCRTSPFEGLVVNSLFALDFLEDETAVSARSPRRAVLAAIHSMQPDAVVLGINHGYHTQISFLDRFAQAVNRFSAKFDSALECAGEDVTGRDSYEGRFLAPEILNLIACDGLNRAVRTAPCEEWERAMTGAGFYIQGINKGTMQRAREMMNAYNKNFGMEQSGGWMKLSWKKVTTQCVSVWKPKYDY